MSETLPLNELPFVYLLWKIHFLTCDNISLTLLFYFFSLFSSFFTKSLQKFQRITEENVLVCHFQEWSRDDPQANIFSRYIARSHEISSFKSNPRALKVHFGTTLNYVWNKTRLETLSLSRFNLQRLTPFLKEPYVVGVGAW